MSIIHRVDSIDGLVEDHARPMLPLDAEGRVDPAKAGPFAPSLTEAQDRLARSARAVARVELTSSVSPFVGTAFAVTPKLLVTAAYVAEALAGSDRTAKRSIKGANVDFAVQPTEAASKIAVTRAHFVHPYWPFAFLEIAGWLEPDRIAAIAPPAAGPDVDAGPVCVIGYPALDLRERELNAVMAMAQVFGDAWGVKRLMPGKIIGRSVFGPEAATVLSHDCSTTPGTGGAPLIDVATGIVIGIHLGGEAGKANYAEPAWQINRDPQWRFWNGAAEPASPAPPADVEPPRDAILTFDEMRRLTSLLITRGLRAGEDPSLLFLGLPLGFLSRLPLDANPHSRLKRALDIMNRETFLIEGHPPLYYVLANAADLRSYDPDYCDQIRALQNALAGFTARGR